MTDELTFNPKGHLTIEDVQAWMDGGTVTLITRDKELNNFEIEFVQKMSLVKRDTLPYPGSLLLGGKEVEIRSELESKIISAIKTADWGQKIVEKEKSLLRQMITECVDFITSDKYIEVSKKFGRIN
jgi:hypothetical protein